MIKSPGPWVKIFLTHGQGEFITKQHADNALRGSEHKKKIVVNNGSLEENMGQTT